MMSNLLLLPQSINNNANNICSADVGKHHCLLSIHRSEACAMAQCTPVCVPVCNSIIYVKISSRCSLRISSLRRDDVALHIRAYHSIFAASVAQSERSKARIRVKESKD